MYDFEYIVPEFPYAERNWEVTSQLPIQYKNLPNASLAFCFGSISQGMLPIYWEVQNKSLRLPNDGLPRWNDY